MHRFYGDPDRIVDDTAFLMEEEARHAVSVLRLRKGDHIEIILNEERYESEIVSAGSREVCVRILALLPSAEPHLRITLYQGLPKSDKMDLIVQKATELGVSKIVPVQMERCVSRIAPQDVSRKLERWRRIVREAGKQCGRSVIPKITEPYTLFSLPALHPSPELNIVPWEEVTGNGPLAFHDEHPNLSSLGILIGPEGGITHDEIDWLEKAGFLPITLGKRILRTETAGIAAVSSLMCLYGEME